jgi:hypothetical protein
MAKYKDYLGDAVYADFDGYHIVLTTEDGISVSNRICLEPSVMAALKRYEQRVVRRLEDEEVAQ